MAVDKKYFKPKSLTWLSGAVPIIGGTFIAFEPIHQLAEYTEAVHSVFGGTPPGVLINGGLALIGLRGMNG